MSTYHHDCIFNQHFNFSIKKLNNYIEDIPILIFQINSIDYWTRQSIIGYGYIKIPIIPGYYKRNIKLWKPISSCIRQKMISYYCGSYLSLHNIKNVIIDDDNNHPSNRSQIATMTNNYLDIILNIVQEK
eukprot:GHVL01024351.1.p2 GENE.GHVL01024351.1~~GHVL01024351.1.p2  ORF type:complete len:130 (-),score=35.59 GHVL01024351.1:620-1009(-)